MNRKWLFISTCFVAALAAFSAYADGPVTTAITPMGDMVDADMPTTYRLPTVTPLETSEATAGPAPLFAAPLDGIGGPGIPAAHQPAKTPETAPAGSPPDDGLGAVGGGAGNASVGSVPADITPIEIAQRETFVVEPADEGRVEVTAYTPTTTELTSQLLPAVQRGFGLAQRGALFAARTEFVQVLRRVAQAQDASTDTDKHSRALAAGLRALDEAEDFVPEGVQLEAELDVRKVASSHRTAVLPENGDVSSFEAVAVYHQYAQEQLKAAVSGEQTGSMALYGLGTIYARLAQRSDDDVQLTRSALTMYSASLAACPNNHLAANELGVLVCRSGRADEAIALFEQTINAAPSAVAYHNLAMAQQRIGLSGPAAANEMESQRLAALERSRGEVSRRAGVHWVTPAEMARSAQPATWRPTAGQQEAAPPSTKSAWQKMVDSAKALPRPGGGHANENLQPMQGERVARPQGNAANQGQWR